MVIDYARTRAALIAQLRLSGELDDDVLAALAAIPRERFVPEHGRAWAYADTPMAIGSGQTISQPFIVAFMATRARIGPGTKVLDIGTGSGYAAAVAAQLGAVVFSIEIRADLSERASRLLDELGYTVNCRVGDGMAGWPDEAPFDAIIAAAALPEVPQAWIDQLAEGGRIIAPVGPPRGAQELVEVVRSDGGSHQRSLLPVRFVAMVTDQAPLPQPAPADVP